MQEIYSSVVFCKDISAPQKQQNVKIVPVSAWAFSRSQVTNSCGDLYIGVSTPDITSLAGH